MCQVSLRMEVSYKSVYSRNIPIYSVQVASRENRDSYLSLLGEKDGGFGGAVVLDDNNHIHEDLTANQEIR